MQEKVRSIEAAISTIAPGSLVCFGGTIFRRKPMALIRELIRQKIGNLRVTTFLGSIDVDMVVGAGLASEVLTSYTGFERHGLAPNVRREEEAGRLRRLEMSEWTYLYGLRAAKMGLPFLPTRGGLGSDFLEPAGLQTITCPYTGETLVAARAIQPDVTLLHAWRADRYGHVQWPARPDFLDEVEALFARAAKRVIVSVEEIVETEVIREHPEWTRLFHYEVEAVVPAPRGAAPCAFAPFYEEDEAAIAAYLEQAREGGVQRAV